MATNDTKKIVCKVLTANQFKDHANTYLSYKSYPEYLRSRPVKPNPNKKILELLIDDNFSYDNLEKWTKWTEKLNSYNKTNQEMYLPPCYFPGGADTGKIEELNKKLPQNKKNQIRNVKKSRTTFQAGFNIGFVNVKSDDQYNSKFDLRFFKISGLAQYALSRDFFVYAGLGINNYYYVSFTSSTMNQKSNKINSNLDTFFGLRAKNASHSVSLQYDNLNYFLNESDSSGVSLLPTRVDRISLQDAYSLGQRYFLLGSLGVYQPLFSKASGYDFGLGGGVKVDSRLSLNLIYSQNKINKNQINNTSRAYVLGARYIF
jgi:hypothetical protein